MSARPDSRRRSARAAANGSKSVILDTSYLVARFNPRDRHHAKALELDDRFQTGEWEELVLLDAVLAETMGVLMNRTSYAAAKAVGDQLRRSEEIRSVPSSPLLDSAWYEFAIQTHGKLSLVDCMLVVAADRLDVPQIATFDAGFDEMVGLTRVP